jgi:uncharacterized LabA/DUF88 family protein
MFFMQTKIYIDWANLYQWVKKLWWINYKRFFQWLKDKFQTEETYIFLWYSKENFFVYKKLKNIWFKLIFKESLEIDWKKKWNCDAELVLKVVSDFYEKNFSKIILITWDWDFACLIDFLREKWCEIKIVSPNKDTCSYLLKKRNVPIIWLEQIILKLQTKENPHKEQGFPEWQNFH